MTLSRGRPTKGKPDQEICKRIRNARQNKGLSIVQLAAMLNVSETTVRNWEKGRNAIDDFWLQSISNVCDADYFYLSNQEGKAQKIIQESNEILKNISSEDIVFQDCIANLLRESGINPIEFQTTDEYKDFLEYMKQVAKHSIDIYFSLNKNQKIASVIKTGKGKKQ